MAEVAAKQRKHKMSRLEKKNTLIAYSFLAPNFLGFAIFTLVPVVCAILLAFVEWNGGDISNAHFVGLQNFAEIFKADKVASKWANGDYLYFFNRVDLGIALKNTVFYALINVPLTLVCAIALALALFTLIPFVWMISSSLKLDQEVFQYPIRWIPETFHWENYRVIWERVSLLTYFKNTAIIALAVTFLQTLTSSFAAYAFAKLRFKGRDLLFVAYIATIAVPWQAYMLPQFIMMRSMGLYDTLLAMIVLQAFSAFGVFLMRQFYQGIPTELCEAARIDGLSEYGIWAKIMLPLSTAAIATLVIFTFVGTWNDYMGPMIYLTRDENKTIQVGLRRFIQEYTSDYHLIMAASLVSLLPVSVVFLCLQKYFIEGIATSGLKG